MQDFFPELSRSALTHPAGRSDILSTAAFQYICFNLFLAPPAYPPYLPPPIYFSLLSVTHPALLQSGQQHLYWAVNSEEAKHSCCSSEQVPPLFDLSSPQPCWQKLHPLSRKGGKKSFLFDQRVELAARYEEQPISLGSSSMVKTRRGPCSDEWRNHADVGSPSFVLVIALQGFICRGYGPVRTLRSQGENLL